MHCDGHDAIIEFDERANVFHGEIIDLRDVITFQASSASDLRQAFAESLEDYFAFCAKLAESAD
jgi:predicted HicB family RNase H-like nuclease